MTDPTDPIEDRAEQAFRAGFESHADELEPAPLDVRRRGRRVLPLVAAAAAVLMIGGIAAAAVTVGRGGDETVGVSADQPDQTTGPGEGFRRVSQGAVEVDVPDSWGDAYEPRDTCNYSRPEGPYVALDATGLMTTQVGCQFQAPPDQPAAFDFGSVPEEQWQPHLRFQPAGGPDGAASYDGWTVTTKTIGSVKLVLLTDEDTQSLIARVLDSALIVETDANGCDTSSPVQAKEFVRPAPAYDISTIDAVDSVSLCLYPRTDTDAPGLIGSRRLDRAEATSLLEAIKAAPIGGGPDNPENCVHDRYGDRGVVVRLNHGDDTHDVYVYTDWCFGNGFDDGTNLRALTKAACMPIFAEPPVQMQSGSQNVFARCAAHSYG